MSLCEETTPHPHSGEYNCILEKGHSGPHLSEGGRHWTSPSESLVHPRDRQSVPCPC